MQTPELRQLALSALCEPDPSRKCEQVAALQALAGSPGRLGLQPQARLQPTAGQPLPGRPPHPTLIAPGRVPQRLPHTLPGRAALLHAICHIEFNAINLALDAVWRFAGMPDAFYFDWLRVAAEEARHFTLLRAHLRGLAQGDDGQPRWDYGSFEAHDGLWAMCEKTADDSVARMALVPRTLEARGLDATPLIQAKLRQVGTSDALQAIGLLDLILRDEVGHVAIGNRWYRWLCEQQGLEPIGHYIVLARRHSAPRLKPPFNDTARRAAGFSQAELDYLQQVV